MSGLEVNLFCSARGAPPHESEKPEAESYRELSYLKLAPGAGAENEDTDSEPRRCIPVLALQFWGSPISRRPLAQHSGEFVDIALRNLALDLVGNGGAARLGRRRGLPAFARLELSFL
jgi:hypothetical protein